MTREESIKVLDTELKERSAGYYDYLQHYGHKDKAEEDYLDALFTAIAALRRDGHRYVLLSTPPADAQTIETGVPFTNADHIRSMTDEELAEHNVQDSLEYTVDYDWDDNPIGEYTPCFKTSDGAIFWSYEDAVKYELSWLREPYKEDT